MNNTLILWEEKNLIEPKTKLENNLILGQKDIINEIKSSSVKRECEDIGKRKKEYNKQWYIKNRDRLLLRNKKYYEKHREERIKSFSKNRSQHVFKKLSSVSNRNYKNGIITSFDLWKIAKKQKLKCALTGEKLVTKNISLDHIIPKSKGGLNISSNVRLVLYSVNIARQNMTDEEFIIMCKKVMGHCRKNKII